MPSSDGERIRSETVRSNPLHADRFSTTGMIRHGMGDVDHAAERTLLGFLANYDSQVDSVLLDGPLASDLPELLLDLRQLREVS